MGISAASERQQRLGCSIFKLYLKADHVAALLMETASDEWDYTKVAGHGMYAKSDPGIVGNLLHLKQPPSRTHVMRKVERR